jgi:flagellar biosynthesis/type III secretory pathway protein FliH
LTREQGFAQGFAQGVEQGRKQAQADLELQMSEFMATQAQAAGERFAAVVQ